MLRCLPTALGSPTGCCAAGIELCGLTDLQHFHWSRPAVDALQCRNRQSCPGACAHVCACVRGQEDNYRLQLTQEPNTPDYRPLSAHRKYTITVRRYAAGHSSCDKAMGHRATATMPRVGFQVDTPNGHEHNTLRVAAIFQFCVVSIFSLLMLGTAVIKSALFLGHTHALATD